MEARWRHLLRIPDVHLSGGEVPPHYVKAIRMDVERGKEEYDNEKMCEVLQVYAARFPCDGYCQGMHFMVRPFLDVFGNVNDATWGLVKMMAEVRLLLPAGSDDKWKAFYEMWEGWFSMFSGLAADEEHVMALKWGVFRLAPSATTEELVCLWNAMFEYPPRLRGVFTAAVAAARIRRERIADYDPRVAARLRFERPAGLVRIAKRTMEVYKEMYV